MNTYINIRSLILYVLGFLLFFCAGGIVANLARAGENQGLAAGAIVFGYAIIGGLIGIVATLIMVGLLPKKIIVRLNLAFSIAVMLMIGVFFFQAYQKRAFKKKEEKEHKESKPLPATKPVIPVGFAPAVPGHSPIKNEEDLGLGFFVPWFTENEPVYFYGNINFEKTVQDHAPIDSITFLKTEFHGIDIKTAPPWLQPAHLKLDYEILYFKATAISLEWIEVIVNQATGQRYWLPSDSGKLLFWPEFLLRINSVELLDQRQSVKVKPLENAANQILPFQFLRPIKVQNEWMEVELQNNGFQKIGAGWIKWRENGQLLILYNLLS